MKSSVRRSPIRLARPFSPITVSVLVLLVWWVVAHTSGSGWVQVLGDAVFGLLVVGLLAPAVALSRIRLGLGYAPGDGAAGLPVVVTVHSSGRARVTPLEPPGPQAFVGRTGRRFDSDVTLLPVRRGAHEEIVVEVSTAAPFGLQWWTRSVALRLPAPLLVAPRLGHPIPLPSWVDQRSGSRGPTLPAETGDARGVRDYRHGDRRRRVHWAATAHAGRLMVREMEEPSAQPVTLKVNLPVDDDAAERTAAQALGTVVALQDRGVPVVLATEQADGTVVQPVADRRVAGRRLARATPSHGPSGLEVEP